MVPRRLSRPAECQGVDRQVLHPPVLFIVIIVVVVVFIVVIVVFINISFCSLFLYNIYLKLSFTKKATLLIKRINNNNNNQFTHNNNNNNQSIHA